MTYYADIIWALNFVMNFFILYMTSKILKKTPAFKRICLGSAISALFSLLFIPIDSNSLTHGFLSVIILTPAILTSFNPKSITEFIKQVFFSYITAFLAGGFIFAMINFPKTSFFSGNRFTFTAKHLFLYTFIFFIFAALGKKFLKTYITDRNLCCEIKIHFMGKTVCHTGFIDTGNLLKDPVTGCPVIIAEFHSILGLIPKGEYKNLDSPHTFEYFEKIFSAYGIPEKLRLLPYCAFGEKQKYIPGFISDFTEIYYSNEKSITIKNLVIGITPENFRLPSGAGFLVNPEIFK